MQGQIGLVHPIELSRESLETWQQQLEDYEILQPIEQLNREVYRLTQEEQEGKSLERFGGMLINDLSLGGKLAALGWYRGSVLDAGGFYTYYREDVSLGLGAELHFSGSFVGSGSMGGEEVTVYDVRFYKAGTIERGSYRTRTGRRRYGKPEIEVDMCNGRYRDFQNSMFPKSTRMNI